MAERERVVAHAAERRPRLRYDSGLLDLICDSRCVSAVWDLDQEPGLCSVEIVLRFLSMKLDAWMDGSGS